MDSNIRHWNQMAPIWDFMSHFDDGHRPEGTPVNPWTDHWARGFPGAAGPGGPHGRGGRHGGPRHPRHGGPAFPFFDHFEEHEGRGVTSGDEARDAEALGAESGAEAGERGPRGFGGGRHGRGGFRGWGGRRHGHGRRGWGWGGEEDERTPEASGDEDDGVMDSDVTIDAEGDAEVTDEKRGGKGRHGCHGGPHAARNGGGHACGGRGGGFGGRGGGFGGRHGGPHAHGRHGPHGPGRRGPHGMPGLGLEDSFREMHLGGRHHGCHHGGRGGNGGGFPIRRFERWANLMAQQQQTVDEDGNIKYRPEVDVFDGPEAFTVHLSVPGAKKDDIEVGWNAEKSELGISGTISRVGDEEFLKTLALDERKIGAFERKVRLGSRSRPAQVDVEGITARLQDGVLSVEVPKLESDFVEVRKVDIE